MAAPVHRVAAVDSHTGGEPTRIVVAGGPDLGTGGMAERLAVFRERFDTFRSAVVNEPRGSDVMVGGLLCEPVDPACAAGVIFFNNVGYLGMCGHGTIGLVTTLAHLGRVAPGRHRIETPVGEIAATLHEGGDVTIENVPSYCFAQGVTVAVEGHGRVSGDVAWGGNWFYLVSDHGQELALDRVEELTGLTWRIRQALERNGVTGALGQAIDHIELFGPPAQAGADSRNFVLCPGKAYDRSPCGTGTSAKVACLAASGRLAESERWRQESIVGSIFEASYRLDAEGRVVPSIRGRAFVNAELTLLFDASDPFEMGIRAVNTTADVVIMGGGIVGTACADVLSAEGLRVHLVEADVIGGGATAAGMGHLVVMDDSEAQFALTSLSLGLWNRLAPELPAAAEHTACGTLWVAADEEEMDEVHRKHAFYGARGVVSEVLGARQLAEAEPHLRPGLAGALAVPGDRVIYSPCAAAWFAARAHRRGAAVREGLRARATGGGEVRLGNGERISAAHVVDAAGVHAAGEVRPRKGHLAITDRYPGFVRHQLIELGYLKSAHGQDNESVAFNVQPRATGQILIGSSRQFGVEHSRVDAHFLGRMLRRATEYLPGLAEVSIIRAWTGFRAASPDGLPLIGPSARDPQLLLATGHEGLGITTSLGTARLLADWIAKRPSAIPIEPYLPARMYA